MNEILKFEGRDVRIILQNGEPWWVAKDVCDILDISNPSDALARLDDDEKGIASIDTIRGEQQLTTVNEAGLYTLVLGSRKPESKKFKRWIAHEVIPSIRKTGSYAVSQPAPTKFEIMRNMLDAWEAHETQLVQHDRQISTLDSQVATLDRRVDLFGADTHYRTVRAYCNQHKIKVPERRANAIGRKAAKMCRDRGVDIGLVADERHGQVNSYPVEIIAEAVNATEAK